MSWAVPVQARLGLRLTSRQRSGDYPEVASFVENVRTGNKAIIVGKQFLLAVDQPLKDALHVRSILSRKDLQDSIPDALTLAGREE